MRTLRFSTLVLLVLILLLPSPSFAQGIYGCSIVPEGWALVQQGLDKIFFWACTRHDICYRDCNPIGGPYHGYGYKTTCDTSLYAEMLLACQTWSLTLSFPNIEWVNRDQFLNECSTYASYGYALVSTYGIVPYLQQQCLHCNQWACNQGGGVYDEFICMAWCGGINRDDCTLRPWGYECPPCPVTLDLKGNGLKLSGPNPEVYFDLDADGTPNHTSWTRVETKDGFLVLDRNANGKIDDGREFFGTATPLLLSSDWARHGYEVLEEFDQVALGGNQDGLIDAQDRIFGSLEVWLDTNRDAVTQDFELHPLRDLGVSAISLAYYYDEREDQWGNIFRWWSPIYFEDGSESMSVDVFFNRLPE